MFVGPSAWASQARPAGAAITFKRIAIPTARSIFLVVCQIGVLGGQVALRIDRGGLVAICTTCRRIVDLDLAKLPDNVTVASLSRTVRYDVCGEVGIYLVRAGS